MDYLGLEVPKKFGCPGNKSSAAPSAQPRAPADSGAGFSPFPALPPGEEVGATPPFFFLFPSFPWHPKVRAVPVERGFAVVVMF